VIAALLALSQTILGQSALGRFIRAKLQAKLMQMLMEGITEFFRDLAKNIATRDENRTEPAAPAHSTGGTRQTSNRHKQGPPAWREPLPPPDVPNDRAESPGPDPAPESNPEPPAAAPPPGNPRPRPAARPPAAPHRARSPPDKKRPCLASADARSFHYEIRTT
jgi:hypothetical protein